MRRLLVALSCLAAACSTSGGSDAGADLASSDLAVDKAAPCTSFFGQALVAGFGRLDGKALAVVKPSDTQCPRPNNDHVVLEMTVNGEAYRVVINVQSDRAGDQRVQFAEVPHPLTGIAFAEGWHLDDPLDYVTTLGVHSASFLPLELNPLVAAINDRVTLGANLSVYSTTSGGDSTHLVHRNQTNKDGAIVIDPTGASPKYLLFQFADQSF